MSYSSFILLCFGKFSYRAAHRPCSRRICCQTYRCRSGCRPWCHLFCSSYQSPRCTSVAFLVFHTDVLFEKNQYGQLSSASCRRIRGTLSDVLEVGASIPVETNRLARGRKSWRQDQLPSGQPFAGCLGFWRWSTFWQLVQ